MAGFWIFVLIVSTMDTIQPGRRWVTAQSRTEPEVYLIDTQLSVDICDSAHLQCCIFNNKGGEIFWFKQQNRKSPVFLAGTFNPAGETLYSEFQNPRIQFEQNKDKCFVMTITNTTLSDEAVYYCALLFSAGAHLKIKGTSKPTLCNNSSASEPTLHGNMNTQEKALSETIRSLHWTVLGLGTALGLCALLIFSLIYVVLRRRKCEKCRFKTSIENSKETRQVGVQKSEAETLNYAALKISKQKPKAEKRKTGSYDECVYSNVKKTARLQT